MSSDNILNNIIKKYYLAFGKGRQDIIIRVYNTKYYSKIEYFIYEKICIEILLF